MFIAIEYLFNTCPVDFANGNTQSDKFEVIQLTKCLNKNWTCEKISFHNKELFTWSHNIRHRLRVICEPIYHVQKSLWIKFTIICVFEHSIETDWKSCNFAFYFTHSNLLISANEKRIKLSWVFVNGAHRHMKR